ncbi:MAG TPA: hypothetical protein VFS15_14510 [Kofleriaceae bacterium]|nr:hypothetical protein [Kofleriaceae bacterium]
MRTDVPTNRPEPGATRHGRGRLARLRASLKDPDAGWDARLWRGWALASALAYTVILAVVVVLSGVGLDATHVALDHRTVGTLLIATAGAAVWGTVLGTLQWRVLRERIAIPRRSWVIACAVPAVVVWAAVIVPDALAAESAGRNMRVTYFLSVSQALALGPLVGFSQAHALKPYTTRWKSWIPANLVSWALVDAVSYLLSVVAGAFGFAHGKGSPLEAYVLLIAAAPLSGRWMLWVTARRAVSARSARAAA